jgi:hypothetical protein
VSNRPRRRRALKHDRRPVDAIAERPRLDPEFLAWLTNLGFLERLADLGIELDTTPDDLMAEDLTITPQMAAEWLEVSRSVCGPNDPVLVARYAGLMASGQWEEQTFANGLGADNPVHFDGQGRCRYGLQRLEACVMAGVPFRAAVVYRDPQTVDEYAFEAGAIEAGIRQVLAAESLRGNFRLP